MSDENGTPGGLEPRLASVEGRFAALERRYAIQEELLSRILSLIV
jgi:hypothetical protein